MGSPTDQLLADDSRDASHVPTRPAPSSRGFFTKGPHKASRQISLPPRNKFGFVTRTLKKSAKETSPVSPQTPSDDTSRKSRRRVVKEPRTVREEDPNHVSEVMTNDPLIERFEKLRLPLTASSSSSSRYRKDPSLPQTSHKTPDTAQQAQSSMEASKIKRPFLGERPRPDPQQRAQHNRGTAVIDESEDELIVLPKRRKANFSSTNFFQLAEQSRQSSDQRRSRAERLSQKKPAQRSRSPYSLDSSSDAIHTPGSSELSHEDLPLHVALFIQEEEDLLLAQRLQDEEVGLHAQGLTRARGAQHDGAATASSGRPSSKAKVYSKRVDSSRKRTVVSRGTIENPINLGSDVDEPRTAIPERARIQDYVALHGEPMNIDGMDQFRPRHAKRSHPTPKKNREPKQKVPKRSRDCVVCGDGVQIVDLPWLASCDHQPETCTDCYAGWISAQLQDSSWREVTCPGNGCKVKLSYHEIQSWASPETFQQYDTFIARAAFSDDRKWRVHLSLSLVVC